MKLFAYLDALALACVVLLLAAVSAEAQTLGDSLLAVFRPYLVELAGIFVAALAAWLFKLIREKLGLDIEARHREAFQTALTPAAGLLIGSLGSGALAARLPVDGPGIAEGVTYVQQAATPWHVSGSIPTPSPKSSPRRSVSSPPAPRG